MALLTPRLITIYLGGRCNFNCTYCDRDSISEIGYQTMRKKDIPGLVKYITSRPEPPHMLSFHGGEPFLYVSMMDQLLEALVETGYKLPRIFIQTNGSRILNHKPFMEKWKDVLFCSISHDFMYQVLNRSEYDIGATLQYLNSLNIGIQLQHVIPSNQPDVMSPKHIQSILDLHYAHRIEAFDFIMLRHIRGAQGKFKVVLDDIDIPRLFHRYFNFLSILYANHVNFYIDGVTNDKINKTYWETPMVNILGPDGFIYPEFDFIEYQVKKSRIGSWRYGEMIDVGERYEGEDSLIYDTCKGCSAFDLCGLKYINKDTNTPVTNPEKCASFYHFMEIAFEYHKRLKAKPSLFRHFMTE